MKTRHLAAVSLLTALALSMGCSSLPSPSSIANMLRPGASETTLIGIVGTVAEKLANGDAQFTLCRSSNERSLTALCADSITVTVPRILKDEVAKAFLLTAAQPVTVTGDGNADELEARSLSAGKAP